MPPFAPPQGLDKLLTAEHQDGLIDADDIQAVADFDADHV
jgi:hypothetical protein